MNSLQFLTEINKSISLINKDKIKIATKLFKNFKPKKSKVIIVGNGGNSSTANHASNDFTNYAKIEAVNFNDHNLITCFANDFGYENWVKKALSYYCKKKDIVILLSAGGSSKNIINAARYCIKHKIKLITLSGINNKNKLQKMGNVNFFVNSKNYNIVETIHLTILLTIIEELKK